MSRFQLLILPSLAIIALLIGTVAIGQVGGSSSSGLVGSLDNAVFARTKIIKFDDTVALFDSATGELFRFRGDLAGSNARGTFVPVARPVAESTSGFLQVQQIDNATFLIDAVTGDVWILRQRGRTNASWVPVSVQ